MYTSNPPLDPRYSTGPNDSDSVSDLESHTHSSTTNTSSLRDWQHRDRCPFIKKFSSFIPLCFSLTISTALCYFSHPPCYNAIVVPACAGIQVALSALFLTCILKNRCYLISKKDIEENNETQEPLLAPQMYNSYATPCGELVSSPDPKHKWDLRIYGFIFVTSAATLIATASLCISL